MSLSRPLVRTAIVGATVALTALGLSPLASADDLEGTFQPSTGEIVRIKYTDASGLFCMRVDSNKPNAGGFNVSLVPEIPKGATASSAVGFLVKPNTGWKCEDHPKFADEDTLYTYTVSRDKVKKYEGTFRT